MPTHTQFIVYYEVALINIWYMCIYTYRWVHRRPVVQAHLLRNWPFLPFCNDLSSGRGAVKKKKRRNGSFSRYTQYLAELFIGYIVQNRKSTSTSSTLFFFQFKWCYFYFLYSSTRPGSNGKCSATSWPYAKKSTGILRLYVCLVVTLVFVAHE